MKSKSKSASCQVRSDKRSNQRAGRRLAVAASVGLASLALTSPRSDAATRTWNGGGADNNWLTVNNWGGTAPVAGDALVFDGVVQTTAGNNFAAATAFAGITFNTTAASFTLSGNSLTLGGDIVDNSLNAQTISLPLVLGVTPTVNVSPRDGALSLGGVISGGFGLTKTGSGLLTLSGATNTFTGLVTVSGGTLAVAADGTTATNPLGNGASGSGGLALNGGALRTSGTMQLSTNRGIALGSGSAGTGGTLDVNGGTTTYNGVAANNGGANSLTKTGSGTLTLGGVNTYTGDTIINQGTLKLDFTQLAGTTTNIINSASRLVLGGPPTAVKTAANSSAVTLNVTSKSAANSSQTFSDVVLGAGTSTGGGAAATISTSQTAGGNVLLNLGAITRNAGGMVNFIPAGTVGATNAILATNANTNGILGGWATLNGVSYATNDGSNRMVAYTGYTAQAAGAIASSATANAQVTAGGAVALTTTNAATTDLYTLSSAAASTGAKTVSVGTTGVSLTAASTTSGSSNVTVASTAALTVGMTITGPTIPAGATVASITDATHFVLSTPAVAPVATAITGLTLGANTSTGVLRLGANGGLMNATGSGAVTIGNVIGNGVLTAGGATNAAGEINLQQFSGGITINSTIADNGAGAVKLSINATGASPTSTLNGANTYTGGTFINQGRVQAGNNAAFGTGPVTILQGGQAYLSSNLTVPNNFFIAGIGAAAGSEGALRLDINTVSTGTITLIGDARIGARNRNGTFAGQITGDYALDIGDGIAGGSVTLSSPLNNWGGNTNMNTTLFLGASDVLPDGAGKGNFNLANQILEMNGKSETINGLIGSTGTVRNNIASTASILTVGGNNATATFAGSILDNGGTVGLTKIGNGIQTLSSATGLTYTGATTINGGVLNVTSTNGLNAAGAVAVNATATSAGELRSATKVGNVTVSANNGSNVAHVNPGTGAIGAGSIATLAMSSLNVNGGSLDFDLTTTIGTNDLLQVAGAVSFNAASALTLYGAATTGTYTLATAGSAITYGTNPTINVQTVGRPASATLNFSDANKLQVDVVSAAAALKWVGNVASGTDFNWDKQATANFFNAGTSAADVFFANDNVTFDDTATNTAVTLVGTLAPGSVTFNNVTKDYTFAGTGLISGTTSLVKNGAAKLTIGNANTYSGGTTISAGTVQLNDVGTLGTGAVTNNGTLVLNNGSTLVPKTYGNVTSGSGQLRKTGAGAVTLTGDHTYSGSTEIDQGALAVNGTLATGGAVNVNTSATAAGELRGTGTVGTVTLQANNGANVATLSPGAGGINSIGTLIASGVSAANGNFIFDVTTPAGTGDLLQVSNALTFAGASTITVNPTAPPVNGTITLATAGSPVTYGVTPTVVGLAGSYRPATYTLNTSDPNKVQVDVVAGALSLVWTGTDGTNPTHWDINTSTNWQDGVPSPQKYFDGDNVTFNSVGATKTINLAATLTPGSVTVDTSAGNYTFGGTGLIAGTGTLTKSGAGTLFITNANTYSGSTTISAGAVQLNDGGRLGTGAITNDGSIVVNNVATQLTMANAIGGAGQITKQNAGTLQLTGDSTYSGGTTLSAGLLQVGSANLAGNATTALGTGTLTLAGGTLQNIANMQLPNPISVTASTATTLSGNNNAGGNLILTGAISGSGTLKSDPTIPSLSTSVVFRGSLSDFNGTIDYTTSTGNGSNFLFGDNTGASPGFPNSVNIDGSHARFFVHGTGNGKSVSPDSQLIGTFHMGELSGDGSLFGSFNGGGTMTFIVGALNTNSTFSGVIANNGTGVNAGIVALTKDGTGTLTLAGANTFTGDTNINSGTLKLASSQALQNSRYNAGAGLVFDAAVPSHAFVLGGLNGGGNLALVDNGGNPVALSVGNNNVSGNDYSGTLSGAGSLTKVGTGSTSVSGNLTYTGSTTVSAGTLLVQANLVNSSAVSVTAGTLQLTANGGRVIKTPSLSVTGTGKLDLVDNKLIVTGAGATATATAGVYTGTVALIKAGANNGAQNGVGIITSMTDALAATHLTTFGTAAAGDVFDFNSNPNRTFAGQSVAATDLLVMYTYGGDANLDGKINGDDYFSIDQNINALNKVINWRNGDFNYDGRVNGDDYFVIDSNIGRQGTPFSQSGGIAQGGGISDVTAVPEPASAGLLLTAACGLAARRRRRRRNAVVGA